MIKVVKFGGSSVASAAQFRKVKHIIESDPDRRFVVTSACGKANKEDHKVTDLLYLCQAHVKYGVSCDSIFDQIVAKYEGIKQELGLSLDLDHEFAVIKEVMKQGDFEDYLVSRGEYLTARLLAEYLGFEFVDAADVIPFAYDGTFDEEKARARLEKHIKDKGIVVPGFYGAMPNGEIKVMSRGGSDVTGAYLANLLDADVYENWTDVSGFYVADPGIIKDPVQIPRITYSELREMSYMGANVLHDDAVFPVKSKNIPINIRNTNAPQDPGTMIMESCCEEDQIDPPHAITGITGRKDFTVLTVIKSHSSTEIGFLRKMLSVFEEFRVSVESLPVTVDTFSVILRTQAVHSCLYDIVARLKKVLQPDEVRIEDHLALIAVVGRAMKEQPGMSGRLLSELGHHRINIKVISQSSDELSIVVGVMDRDFNEAIKCIYDKFIAEDHAL